MSEIFNIYRTRKPEMQSPPLRTAKDLFLHMVDESDNDYQRMDISCQAESLNLWNNDAGNLYAGRINANNEMRIIMWKEPIVQEVRKAGEELAEQANYNLLDLFQRLRDNEKKSKAKVVAGIKKKNLQKAG